MATIYITEKWSGFGKQNYYWHEYRYEAPEINLFKCHKWKIFDGNENSWMEDEKLIETWTAQDPNMPEWLRQYL